MRPDFEHDLRYCETCRGYVRFLLSPADAYCVECGSRVTLFSSSDALAFRAACKPRPFDLQSTEDEADERAPIPVLVFGNGGDPRLRPSG